MNNNLNTERALRDVFATTSYIDIGEKDNPLSYPVKLPKREAEVGKQFAIAQTKTGKYPTSYFDPQHKWVMDGVQYVDTQRYAETQTERKKGFLTSDFSRRDEFSKDFATNQYRERLKMEYKHTHKTIEGAKELRSAIEAELGGTATATAVPKRKVPLYDLVYDVKAAPAIKYSMRAGRDTNNPTQTSWNRNFGTMKLSSHEFGYGVATGKPGSGTGVETLEGTLFESTVPRMSGTKISKPGE